MTNKAKMENLLPQISIKAPTYSYRIHLSNFWVSHG
ncbi:hypothetical protein RDI58_029209 [Solanum bulbocastanum]|uniref:Uncharacterized protein n=1 Tax=Solanum bulbocastanum TaxID=147425 RepID=A0AAN8ST71_SOLBU